jgi:hypothetical protein
MKGLGICTPKYVVFFILPQSSVQICLPLHASELYGSEHATTSRAGLAAPRASAARINLHLRFLKDTLRVCHALLTTVRTRGMHVHAWITHA